MDYNNYICSDNACQIITIYNMEKNTREEALRRWSSAKAQKKELVEKMRKMLYEDYKARTGEEPLTFNVL